MSGELERRWVPIAALPIDLIVELRTSDFIDVRRHRASRRALPRWPLLFLGAALATAGVLLALLVPGKAFSFAQRLIPLLGGGVLLGAWAALEASTSFRPEGGQGLLVGPTTLVVVDHDRVEILPAERVSIGATIDYDGTCIDKGTHDESWLTALRAAQEAAQSQPAARARDRWRQAALADFAPRPRAPVMRRILIGAGIGVSLGVFVEAAPAGMRTNEQLERWSDTRAHMQGLEDRLAAEALAQRKEAADKIIVQLSSAGSSFDVIELYDSAPALADLIEPVARERFATLVEMESSGRGVLAVAQNADMTHDLWTDALRADVRGRFDTEVVSAIETADSIPELIDLWQLASVMEAQGALELAQSRLSQTLLQYANTVDDYRELARLARVADQAALPANVKTAIVERFFARAERALSKTRDADEFEALKGTAAELDADLAFESKLYAAIERAAVSSINSASSPYELRIEAGAWYGQGRADVDEAILAATTARFERLAKRADEEELDELADFAGNTSVDIDPNDVLSERRSELRYQRAKSGSIDDMREFLAHEDPTTSRYAKIEKRLDRKTRAEREACAKDLYPLATDLDSRLAALREEPRLFALELLYTMCVDDDYILRYRPAGTLSELAADDALELAQALTEVLIESGRNRVVVAEVSHESPLLKISVSGTRPSTVGTYDGQKLSADCTTTYTRIAANGETVELSSREDTCTWTVHTERRGY